MPRKTLSDRGVAALTPRATRYAYPDPEMPGHYVRVHPSGAKSFVAVTIGADGKQAWITVGKVGTLTIAEARVRAREAIRRVRLGLPAFEIPPGRPATFGEVAQSWLVSRWFRQRVMLCPCLPVHKPHRVPNDVVEIAKVHLVAGFIEAERHPYRQPRAFPEIALVMAGANAALFLRPNRNVRNGVFSRF
jgi:hypothetical protein